MGPLLDPYLKEWAVATRDCRRLWLKDRRPLFDTLALAARDLRASHATKKSWSHWIKFALYLRRCLRSCSRKRSFVTCSPISRACRFAPDTIGAACGPARTRSIPHRLQPEELWLKRTYGATLPSSFRGSCASIRPPRLRRKERLIRIGCGRPSHRRRPCSWRARILSAASVSAARVVLGIISGRAADALATKLVRDAGLLAEDRAPVRGSPGDASLMAILGG